MFITEAFAATAAVTDPAVKGAFPPFDTSTYPSQLLWLAITFGLLYYMMSRVALPRVSKILESRSARISDDVNAASAAQKAADDAGAHYEKTLGDAKAIVQKSAQEMREKLAAESDSSRKALEADLNVRLNEAEAKIAAGKAQAMSNVSTIAADAAGAIVRQITGREADPKAVAQAIAGLKA
jgi:F-type H+-transporting ATPase subunit b